MNTGKGPADICERYVISGYLSTARRALPSRTAAAPEPVAFGNAAGSRTGLAQQEAAGARSSGPPIARRRRAGDGTNPAMRDDRPSLTATLVAAIRAFYGELLPPYGIRPDREAAAL